MLNCLQDANADVSEKSLGCVLKIQERNLPLDSLTSAHLLDVLVVGHFASKREENLRDATLAVRSLLREHLPSTLPVLLKGTTSRSLQTSLQCVLCISQSLGKEICGPVAGAAPDAGLLSPLVEQLLRVIATAKVSVRPLCPCRSSLFILLLAVPLLACLLRDVLTLVCVLCIAAEDPQCRASRSSDGGSAVVVRGSSSGGGCGF